MKPGIRAGLTVPQFVGKNSPNPNTPWYRNDYKDFGPAVGFAWQVPWFGAGKTTLRGGYQMTFQQGQVPNALTQENVVPGSTYSSIYQGDPLTAPYLDLTKVQANIPAPVPIKPMQGVPDLRQAVSNLYPVRHRAKSLRGEHHALRDQEHHIQPDPRCTLYRYVGQETMERRFRHECAEFPVQRTEGSI